MTEKVHGYKVFQPDWTCSPSGGFKQYSCPGRFQQDGDLDMCGNGMHFCLNLADCFNYYSFNPDNKVAEVIAHGEVIQGDDKCCTNALEVVRERDWNTGDWNLSSFNTGCFMTDEQPIMMFNKPSDWTFRKWLDSDARWLLNHIPKNVTAWVYACDMTDQEKADHPEHKTTGGYLKTLDEADAAQTWWDGLDQCKRDIILNLPNFDADIFFKCTGINVKGEDNA